MTGTRPAGPLRVVQLSDCHLYAEPGRGKRGLVPERAFDAVLEHIRRCEPALDLVLATGDLAHDASPEAYRRLHAGFASLGAPVHCLPGNHDDPARMAELLDAEPVRYLRSVQADPWRIVLLDSVIPGEDRGALAASELARLESELAAAAAGHALVALHHPPLPTGNPDMDAMGLAEPELLFARLGAHACVRGVLWGHVHTDLDLVRGGLRLMATPSTGFQFRFTPGSIENDPAPPAYRRLSLWPDGRLDTDVVRVPEARRLALEPGPQPASPSP